MAHDRADLVVVDAFLDHAHQGGGDAGCLEIGQRLARARRRRSAPRMFFQRRRASANRIADRSRSPALARPASATKAWSRAMRTPLVFSMSGGSASIWRARRMSRICGWIVGSPPEICTRSGSPSLATSSIQHALRSPRASAASLRAGEDSAKHTGQVRLHVSLISISARQECCSWSGQRPQS